MSHVAPVCKKGTLPHFLHGDDPPKSTLSQFVILKGTTEGTSLVCGHRGLTRRKTHVIQAYKCIVVPMSLSWSERL